MDGIVHQPVLKDAVLKAMNIKNDGIYVDCTLGEGGHSKAILSLNETCKVIGIEQDEKIKSISDSRLSEFGDRFISDNRNFSDIDLTLKHLGINNVDGVLMDLGISSFHYEKSGRGFSFSRDEILDMRLSADCELSAADVVNNYAQRQLEKVIADYGEERFFRRIVSSIIKERERDRIDSTMRLAEIIANAIPKRFHPKRIHPATRTFQAIRIEVNRELEVLKIALSKIVDFLNPGGRLCVISFHSLEDRIVKRFMKDNIPQCRCPEYFPVCTCGRPGKLKIITKKPIVPDENEISDNARSRSSKLRVAEKI